MSYFDAFSTTRAARVQAQEEIVIEDESSDDEMENVAQQRRRSKAISDEAALCRSLPAGARQKAPQTPFTSMMMLAEAAVMMKEITSVQPDKQSTNHRILQEIKAANLLPTSGATAEPLRKPERPSTPKSSRPTPSRSKSKVSLEISSTPTKPAAARQQSEESNAAQCCKFFCMDVADVMEDSSTGNATVRDSSLTRGYDALGAQHFSLDDGGEADLGSTAPRASSITRGYDALKGSLDKLPSQAATLEGDLPPVRPPSRSSRGRTSRSPVARKPLHKTSSGQSAMELDLGLSGNFAARQRSDSRQALASHVGATKPPVPVSKPPLPVSKPPLPESSSPSLGNRRVTKGASRHSSTSLPPLSGVKGAGDSSGRPKQGFTMKTGFSRSALWELPSHRPAMNLGSAQIGLCC
mmetsp:Transcript_36631/g.68506  ORF Transcript_36631/g.68506 Transcript_36631/m.68506 type:complete len:410 (+) Transcript_36631:67-1296(+)